MFQIVTKEQQTILQRQPINGMKGYLIFLPGEQRGSDAHPVQHGGNTEEKTTHSKATTIAGLLQSEFFSIRQKIDDDPQNPRFLKTICGAVSVLVENYA